MTNRYLLGTICLGLAILFAPKVNYALDLYLDIETVEGESTDPGHEGEIDVLAWSWGMSSSSTYSAGAYQPGKANIQALGVTKWVDIASPKLMQALVTGARFAKATLVVRSRDEKETEYDPITITFENVAVTGISTGGSDGEFRPTENVTIEFAKFIYEYKQDGKASPGKFSWNVEDSKALGDGDIDGDAKNTVLDVVALLNHLNGNVQIPVARRSHADLDGDGDIDQDDVTRMLPNVLNEVAAE